MLISSATDTHDLDLYMTCLNAWVVVHTSEGTGYQWQPHQQLLKHMSIRWQELFAIVAAALTWGH